MFVITATRLPTLALIRIKTRKIDLVVNLCFLGVHYQADWLTNNNGGSGRTTKSGKVTCKNMDAYLRTYQVCKCKVP